MNETRRVVRHAATIATLGSRSAFMVVLALLVSCGESSTNATNPRLDFREPRFDIEVTEEIAYGTAETVTGTVELLLDLYEPAGANAPARPPGLLIIHGGGFQGGTRQQAELVMIASEMARRGYIAASIDYRLANPRPLITAEFAPFFEYTGRIDFAAAAVADAIQAYRWMLANTNVDPDHIFVGGGSAGSITAAHLAYSLDNAGQSNRPQFSASSYCGASCCSRP